MLQKRLFMSKTPYGFWKSPIEAGVFSALPSVQELHVSCAEVFWTESRPQEKGRHVLMNSSLQELFPSTNIQSRVHEYGGGAFLVSEDLFIFFDASSFSLCMKKGNEQIVCFAQDSNKRWADFSVSSDQKQVVCICEDHSMQDVKNSLVVIDLETKEQKVIHQKHDFYASPRFSPDGLQLAFIYWNFPFMPWEESFLQILSYPSLQESSLIGKVQESVAQFIWIDSKELVFASDRNGFWNLYMYSQGMESLLYEKEADFASPLWVLGKKNFELFLLNGKKTLACFFTEKGVDHLAFLHLETKTLELLDLPFTAIRTLDVDTGDVYFIGGHFLHPLSVVRFDLQTREAVVLSSKLEVLSEFSSFIGKPQEVSALSSLDQKSIFGFFYPPKNPNYPVDSQSLPPLIIKCHSGPTSQVQALLNGEVQFWTSRGFSWLDVNYRGSSGFGRKYREALREMWGVLEVKDCLDLALSLCTSGKVDPQRMFAKGSSSGGLSALCLAAAYPHLKGCVSYYGVTDLELLTQETHKFERFYLESLVGSYKEFPLRYKERSPCFQSDFILCPVLLFHGDKDKVVSLSQAQEFVKKVPSSSLVVFPGEGHGFKNGETLKMCAEKELLFFQDSNRFQVV